MSFSFNGVTVLPVHTCTIPKKHNLFFINAPFKKLYFSLAVPDDD